MGIEKIKLKKLKRDELNSLAHKLGIKRFNEKKKKELIDHIIANISKPLLRKHLNLSIWKRYRRSFIAILAILGIVLGIGASISTCITFYKSFDIDNEEIKTEQDVISNSDKSNIINLVLDNDTNRTIERADNISNISTLVNRLLSSLDKNSINQPTIVELSTYGNSATNYVLNVLKLELLQQWEMVEDDGFSINFTNLREKELDIEVQQYIIQCIENKKVSVLLDTLKSFAKLNEEETSKAIGEYIAVNIETYVAPLLIYFFPDYTDNSDLLSKYIFSYVDKYLSGILYERLQNYSYSSAFRNYLAYFKKPILLYGPNYDKEGAKADQHLIPEATVKMSNMNILSGIDLSYINISNLKSAHIDYVNIDFLSTRFINTILKDTSFGFSRLDFARFQYSEIERVDFSHVLFDNVQIMDSILIDVKFNNIKAENVIFQNVSKIKNVTFTSCNFKNSYFINVTFENCSFENCSFESVEFNGVNFDEKTRASLDNLKNLKEIIIKDDLISLNNGTKIPSACAVKYLGIMVMKPDKLPINKYLNAEEWHDRGMKYSYAGKYDMAIKAFEKSLNENVDNAETIKQKGIAYYRKGEYFAAVTQLNKAVVSLKDDPKIYYYLGLAMQEIDQLDASIEYFSKAIDLPQPKFKLRIEKAYYDRGYSYYKKNDIQNALKDLNKSIEISGKYSSYYLRGCILFENKDYTNAINDFSEAIKNNDTYINAYIQRAIACTKINDFNTAITDLGKAIEIAPFDPSLYIIRGEIYLNNLNKAQAAIDDYSYAIKLKPEDEILYFKRAIAYIILDETEKAIVDLKNANQYKLGSSEIPYYSIIGSKYAKIGDFKKSIEYHEKDIAEYNHSFDSYWYYATSLAVFKKYKLAVETINKAIEISPNDPQGYYFRSGLNHEIKKNDSALQDINTAISINSQKAEYYVIRAYINYELENLDKAEKDINKAIEINPKEKIAQLAWATYYYAKYEHKKVITYLSALIKEKREPEYFYHRGLAYFSDRQYKLAINDFSIYLEHDNNDNLILCNRAYSYINIYDIGNAQKDLDRLNNINENDTCAVVGFIDINLTKKNYSEAVNMCDDYLIEYGESYDVLCRKAIALVELKKYDAAEEIYRKILKAGSNSECAINGMGVLLERKGLYKEAIAILEDGIKIFPSSDSIHNSLAQSYLSKKNYEKAIEHTTRAIELVKGNKHSYYIRGLAKTNNNDFEGAADDFNFSLKLDNKYDLGFYGLGVLNHFRGRRNEAIKNYSKAIELNPFNMYAYYELGVCYQDKGDYEASIAQFNKAIELNPNDSQKYFSRGLSHKARKEYELAVSDFEKASSLNEKSYQAMFRIGEVYLIQNEYEKAIKKFNSAIEINSEYNLIYYNRGMAYLKSGKITKAIEDHLKGFSYSENKGVFYKEITTKYNDIDPNEIINICKQKLKLENEKSFLYLLLGKTYWRIKNYENALFNLERFNHINKKNDIGYIYAAKIFLEQDDYHEGLQSYDNALKINSQNAETLNSIAWLLSTYKIDEVRDGEKALDYAQKAVELNNSAAFIDTLAAAFAELGDFEHALEYQEKAIEMAKKENKKIETYNKRLISYKNHKPWRDQ